MYIIIWTNTAAALFAALCFIIGFISAAWWYGAHKSSRKEEHAFDERDIYMDPKKKSFISK